MTFDANVDAVLQTRSVTYDDRFFIGTAGLRQFTGARAFFIMICEMVQCCLFFVALLTIQNIIQLITYSLINFTIIFLTMFVCKLYQSFYSLSHFSCFFYLSM